MGHRVATQEARKEARRAEVISAALVERDRPDWTLVQLVSTYQYSAIFNFIRKALKNNAEYLVWYTCQDFCSSRFGAEKIVCVGPTCTIKTLEEARATSLDMELASTIRRFDRVWHIGTGNERLEQLRELLKLTLWMYAKHSVCIGDKRVMPNVKYDVLEAWARASALTTSAMDLGMCIRAFEGLKAETTELVKEFPELLGTSETHKEKEQS